MATISKYQTASGATLYRVRYRTPDRGQTDKRGFKTKRDAEAFAASVEVAKLRGEYVAPSHARVTVDELGPAWLARQRGHLKPSTFRAIDAAWRNHVQPRWGAAPLGAIRFTEVQAWVAELGEGGGPSVVIRAYRLLAAILADAVSDRLLAHNPAAGVKLPPKGRRRKVYLTHEKVAELAGAAGEHEALVLLLAYTGLRWGEAIGLRVRDLDMLRRRVTIHQNAVQVGSEIFVGTPKSHKQRTVPLPAFLLPYLARQCERKDREDLLFPGEEGYMKRPHPTHGWFATAVEHSGVPRVTPHDLRHTAASLAVSAGANVKAVQRMLGHASAAMTLDIYADLFDDDLEAVATKLDEARAASKRGQNVGTAADLAPLANFEIPN